MSENSSDMNKSVLSRRQLQAIVQVLQSRSVEEGLRIAQVSKASFYGWLKDDVFRNEYERQKNELVNIVLDGLRQSLNKAIEVYTKLLDSENESIRKGVAEGIITHNLKIKEAVAIENRLESLERIILIERKTFSLQGVNDGE